MLALIVAAALVTPAACSWEHPGAHKYSFEPHRAIADYHLDAETAGRLEYRMQAHQYDEVVTIERDVIGGGKYSDLRDMHFGAGKLCRGAVDRSMWPEHQTEIGLVYCEEETCVIVPTICNNVALITRREDHHNEPLGIESVAVLTPAIDPALPDLPPPVATETDSEPPYTPFWPGGGGGYYGGGDGPIGGGGGGGGHPPPCDCKPPPVCPPPSSIPEPSTWLMWVVGLIGLRKVWS